MLKNFIKVATRNLSRRKGYSFINIFGLTAGITISCLLLLFAWNEISYDSFHSKSDRMYRIIEQLETPDGIRLIGQTSAAFEDELTSVPEIEKATSLYKPTGHVDFFAGADRFLERSWFIVTPSFNSLFDIEFVEGNPESSLSQPGLIISEESAVRLFGTRNVMGLSLKESSFGDLTITGIFRDFPSNSHIRPDFLFPIANLDAKYVQRLKNWSNYGAHTYILVRDDANLATVQQKLEQISSPHWKDNPVRGGIRLQALQNIYFDSGDIEFGAEEAHGQKFYINLIAGIAFFIIILACINYTNLATARAAQRAREIGMRKVNGALRGHLILQFFGESVIIALLAFLLSIGLVDLLLPSFNQLTGKSFDLQWNFDHPILLLLFSISVFAGLAAGAYPAIYLSKLSPAVCLKGELRTGRKNLWLRQGLVIFQFSISIIMLVATLVVNKQVDYVQTRELGFDKENILVIDINNGNVRRSFETMKNEFLKIPGVQRVASSSRVPGEWKNISQVTAKPAMTETDSIVSYFMCFDPDVISTFNLQLIAGRNFINHPNSDSLNVILNETAARHLGLIDPINAQIWINIGEEVRLNVIGVLKDFNFQSLHEEIQPLIIGYWSNPVTAIDYFSLKFQSENIPELIKNAAAVHANFDQSTAMEYHFLDQQLQEFYLDEIRQARVFSAGSVLAIIIACLGLLGLASFMMERKMKEIGVRKILGASKSSLFLQFNWTFMIQILISLLFAIPISFFLMQKWLSFFAFRIGLNLITFLVPGLAVMLVAFAVAGFHTLRASVANPVEILKSE